MIADLVVKMRSGSRRALARLLSLIENDPEAAQEIVAAVYAQTGQAHIVGVTGAPGSGKSTLVTQLVKAIRQRGLRVAVLAIDPSSPYSGGALLGDRVRMSELSGDNDVFIRSVASRGTVGGLARTTGNALKLLDAAGFELIIVETVGAGQAEVDIANAAHTTVVLETPGMGDEVQSIKAGILEIADILVVNKADKPGASKTLNALKQMLHQGPLGGTRHHGRIDKTIRLNETQSEAVWQPPVLPTIAPNNEGVAEVVDKLFAHRAHLQQTGQWQQRENARARQELEDAMQERLLRLLTQAVSEGEVETKATAVAERRLDVYTAVEQLIKASKDSLFNSDAASPQV